MWETPQRREWAAIILLMAACIVAKLWFLKPVGPILFFDELIYKQDADALATLSPYPSGQYPFGYPLAITPAILLGAGYQGIFWINVVLTTMLVPACFLLAKEIRSEHAWLAAAVAALLPLQTVFPTQVLSENLYVPMFVFVVWFAVRGRCTSASMAFLYGLALGGLFLIKYLALPAIPLIWVMWLYGIASTDGGRESISWRRAALFSGVAVLGAIVAWFAFIQLSGISVVKAGSRVSGIHAAEIGPASIAMWASAYAAAICLLAGPFLPLLASAVAAVCRTPLQWMRDSALARLLLLTALLVGGYWLVATLHSAGGASNYPIPQRVVMRYFMALTPLVVVLGLALAFRNDFPRLRGIALAAVIAASLVALFLAHAILYKNAVWSFPPWFATIPLYSSDISGLQPTGMLVFLAALVLASAWSYEWLRPIWVVGVLVLFALCLVIVTQRGQQQSTTRPVHPKVLAPIVLEAVRSHDTVVVVTDLPQEPPRVMMRALVFWGVPKKKIRVITPQEMASMDVGATTPVYLITGRRQPQPLVREYRYGSRTGYVYILRRPAPPTVLESSGDGVHLMRIEGPPLCFGAPGVTRTVSWNVSQRGNLRLAIYVLAGDGNERLFAKGGATGRKDTGQWLRPGMKFRVRAADGRLLDQIEVPGRRCSDGVPSPEGP